MSRIFIAGIETDVGKSPVAAILATKLQAHYWKPIQCGEEEPLLIERIHPPAYTFKMAASPHQAARAENRTIDFAKIVPPDISPLIIEGVGGVLVPCGDWVTLDLFKNWNCHWVIVSRHYLGSINHTLLTVEALKARGINIAGLYFNGTNPDSESAILQISGLRFLGRLLPEPIVNKNIIQKYAAEWPDPL